MCFIALVATSCKDDDDFEPQVCETIEIESGNNQVGVADSALPEPLRVRVTNGAGVPLSNVKVKWEVLTGGGSVSPAKSVTDEEGIAETIWTLGADSGSVRASITRATDEDCTSPTSVVFNAEVADEGEVEIRITDVDLNLLNLNGCDDGSSQFDEIIRVETNTDLSQYYIEVLFEFQFAADTTIESFVEEGFINPDSSTIEFETCLFFGESEYVNNWYTVSIFETDNGEPVGDPIAVSNRFGPIRVDRPEGAQRIARTKAPSKKVLRSILQ